MIFKQNIQFYLYHILRVAFGFLRFLQSIDWSRIILPQSTSWDWLIRILLNTDCRFTKTNTNARFAAGKAIVVSVKSFIWESSCLLIAAEANITNSNVSVVHSQWPHLILLRIRKCFLWRHVVRTSLSSIRCISVLAKVNKETNAKNQAEKSAEGHTNDECIRWPFDIGFRGRSWRKRTTFSKVSSAQLASATSPCPQINFARWKKLPW